MPAGAARVSLEKYLGTLYRPDRDYVDGVLESRNVGELPHSLVFGNRSKQTGIKPFISLRHRLRETLIRVPDVVLTLGKPDEQIPTKPPLACIEVLSPRDTISKMNARIRDYLDFGVPVVWTIDVKPRRVWIYRPKMSLEEAVGSVKLDGTSIEVPFSEIFD